MSFTVKSSVVGVVTLFAVVLLLGPTHGIATPREIKLSYSEFRQAVVDGKVQAVKITNEVDVDARLADGAVVKTILPSDYSDTLDLLLDHDVEISIRQPTAWYMDLLADLQLFVVRLLLTAGMIASEGPGQPEIPFAGEEEPTPLWAYVGDIDVQGREFSGIKLRPESVYDSDAVVAEGPAREETKQ